MRKTVSVLLLLIFCSVPISAGAYMVLPLRHRFDLTYDFLQPTDVAVGRNGTAYVVDGVNNRVVAFDEQGRFRFSFGEKGDRAGQFETPVGITTGSDGTVYIADTGNQRVQLFSPNGVFKSQVLLPRLSGERSREPVDVTVDENHNRLYVTDNEYHQLLVFEIPGYKYLSSLGSEGPRMNQFLYPFLTASDESGALYVVDVLNTRVQQWRDARPERTIGGWGVDLGLFYRPKGVCVDATGLILVGDSVLGVIQAFDREGTFSAVLGDEKGEVQKWKTPLGITVDSHQRLYVVEMILNRVRVYDMLHERMVEKNK